MRGLTSQEQGCPVLSLGSGMTEGFLEEVGPDNEYFSLGAERGNDIRTRRSSANGGEEMGGRLVCSLDQAEGSG